jgi:2-aminoethylphosphonate-pyruvate transaminase
MVAKSILHEFSQPPIFHRYEEFELLFHYTCQKLLKLLAADSNTFATALFTGSGTMANETVLSSAFTRYDKVLVVSNGDFGERLAHILITHHIPIAHLKLDWFTPIDPEQVLKKFEFEKASAIALVAMETSTGMLNPVHEIRILLEREQYENIPMFVDAISAIGYENVLDKGSSPMYITSVLNKALEGPPGLSFACVTRTVLDVQTCQSPDSIYLDLFRYLDFSNRRQTPTTPSVSHVKALNLALEHLDIETIEGRRTRYSNLTEVLVNRLTPLGFVPCITDEKSRAPSMTCFCLPFSIDVNQLRSYLYEEGFVVWFPKYTFKSAPTMIVSVMGEVYLAHIEKFAHIITVFLTGNISKSS